MKRTIRPKHPASISPSLLARGVATALLGLSVAVQAQEVTSVASSDWADGSTWSDGQAPSSAFDYRISSGSTVFSTPTTTSGTYTRIFEGRSLTVSSGGALDLRSTAPANNVYVTYEIPNLHLEADSTLRLRAAQANANRTLATSLSLANSGTVHVDILSSDYNNYLALASASTLSGGADLDISIDQEGAISGERAYIDVRSANNPYSGNWSVRTVNASSNTRRGLLYASAENALGSGSVSLDNAILVNQAVGGLNSISAVHVGARSTLDARASFSNADLLVQLQQDTSTLEIHNAGTRVEIGQLQGVSGSQVIGDSAGQVLATQSAQDWRFDGLISGPLALIKGGAGTLTLTANHGYSGGTTVEAGTLQLGDGGANGMIAGDVELQDAGTLSFNRSDAVTFAGVVSGAGHLLQAGAGTTILTADNTYTGSTTIRAGTLQLGAGGTAGSILGDVVNDGVLVFNRGDALQMDGAISGSGSVEQLGAGTTTLTGMNSYTGTTEVVSGRLDINGDQSAATGAVNVHNGATLGGTGTIGGNVSLVDGAHLAPGQSAGTLSIVGNLQASSGAIFDYEFGQAGVPGGALNDLVDIGGNLVLDGVLNVTVTPGGAFDAGVYRVMNYGGQLTDLGLEIGTAPAGDLRVQTSVPGQVNLLNTNGLTLNFWDGGDIAGRNNQIIDGGVGNWTAAGNDNWTDEGGRVNAPYTPASFAIFGGTGGAVTVDNSEGAVTTSGMQFLVNGYSMGGDDLTLVAPITVVRVGDGTAAGSAVSATIGARLVGATRLSKVDAGTLILTGANTYTGGTAVRGGVLQIASDSNLGDSSGAVTLDGGTLRTTASIDSQRAFTMGPEGGTLDTASGTTYRLSGGIDGSGEIFKIGDGVLQLDAGYASSGAFNLAAGRVVAGAADVFGLQAAYRIDPAATLDLASFSQQIRSVENAGTIQWGMPGTVLTIGSDYVADNGHLAMVAVLGGDDSPVSLMHVMGSTSGATRVSVENRGGLGAMTSSGIKLIDVDGASNGVFTLDGDYRLRGEEILVGGAFGYRLQQNSGNGVEDGDWYLVSRLLTPLIPDPGPLPVDPPGPIFQAGVPIYEVYADTLLELARVDTLWQRTGSVGDGFDSAPPSQARLRPWVRTEGNRVQHVPERSLSHSGYETHSWQIQAGIDALLAANETGAWVGGLSVRTLDGSPRVSSPYGDGRIETRGYGLKATLTWYSAAGVYVDAQLQYDWMKSDLRSTLANVDLTRDNRGGVLGGGIEIGARFPLNPGWSLVPQLQVSYAHANFDRFVDVYDAEVDLTEAESLATRLGAALEYRSDINDRGGRFAGHVIGDLIYDTAGASRVAVSGTELSHEGAPFGTRFGAGGSFLWANGSHSLNVEVSRIDMLSNDSDGWAANISLRGSW